jgi:hypothetical protein
MVFGGHHAFPCTSLARNTLVIIINNPSFGTQCVNPTWGNLRGWIRWWAFQASHNDALPMKVVYISIHNAVLSIYLAILSIHNAAIATHLAIIPTNNGFVSIHLTTMTSNDGFVDSNNLIVIYNLDRWIHCEDGA